MCVFILQLPTFHYLPSEAIAEPSFWFVTVGFRPTSFDSYYWKVSQTGYVVLLSSYRSRLLVERGLTTNLENEIGGIFLSADANRSVYTREGQLYPQAGVPAGSAKHGSWFSRWMFEVTERWTSKGHRNTEGDKLSGLICEDGQMRVLGQRGYWSPINWDGEDVPDGREIGQLMVMNATVSFSSLQLHPPLAYPLSSACEVWAQKRHLAMTSSTPSPGIIPRCLFHCLLGLLASLQKCTACWRLSGEHRGRMG